MVLYLCLKYPMKSKLKLVQCIAQEMLLLVVNICVLIVASLDLSQKENYSTKKILGEIFLYVNMILSMLGPVFIMLMIIEKVIALKQGREDSQSSQVRPMNGTNLPVNIITRAPQGCLQTNNESNLVLAQGGLDQSQINDTSLNPTNLELASQYNRQRIDVFRSNQEKAQRMTTTGHNVSNKSTTSPRRNYGSPIRSIRSTWDFIGHIQY